jgi:hypothetical protein
MMSASGVIWQAGVTQKFFLAWVSLQAIFAARSTDDVEPIAMRQVEQLGSMFSLRVIIQMLSMSP